MGIGHIMQNIEFFFEYIKNNTLLISVISGAFGGLLSTVFVYFKDKKILKYKSKREKHDLALAIHVELSTFFELYERQMLKKGIPQVGSSVSFPVFIFKDDYFPTFSNNAHKMSIFEYNDALDIEKIYMRIKFLINIESKAEERWNAYANFSRMHTQKIYQIERENKLIDAQNVYRVALRYQDEVLKQKEIILKKLEDI